MQKVDLIIAEARSWIDTPFHHQARVKGAGVDCANLILGVGDAAGVLRPNWLSIMTRYRGYGRNPNPMRMRKALEELMIQVDYPQFGDVMWIQWRENIPMHLAIFSYLDGRETMIHAYSPIRKVSEHGFTEEWARRVNSWWRYPGVE